MPTRNTSGFFSGWMFAASPGLHGIEHPIYDIWLTECKGGAAEPEASADTDVQVDLQPPATPEAPQTPAQEPSPPRKGHSNKKRTPVAKAPLDAPPQEQQDAEPSPMDAPIEVGQPPGLIPARKETVTAGARRRPVKPLASSRYSRRKRASEPARLGCVVEASPFGTGRCAN